MQSRKDQVQAYFFVVGRLFSALTHGKPDILESPSRRFSTGIVLGALLAGLLVGIFAVIGIFSPGTTDSWRQPGSIIVDEDSGAVYLFMDNRLRPVLNFASAKLAVGSGSGTGGAVVKVTADSLADVPVGPPIGIRGAPDAIPDPERLDSGPWTVCVAAFSNPETMTLLLGERPGWDLTGNEAFIVSTTDGSKHLLWQGHRYRLPDPTASTALGFNAVTPVPVPAGWLNAIPVGRDIVIPGISGAGDPGPLIDGNPSLVGQIYHVRNPALGSEQVFVVRGDGRLAPLNPTTEALLLSSPEIKKAYPGRTPAPILVSPVAMAGVPVAADTEELDGYPSPLPHIRNDELSTEAQPCVRFELGENGDATFLTMPAAAITEVSAPAVKHDAGAAVDRVAISAGTGVLAHDLPAPGGAPGAEFLITDFGVKYPLAPGAASALGYTEGQAVNVPTQLLALLPAGPVLSPAAALAEGSP